MCGHEFGVGAAFDDTSVLEHQNQVGILDRRDAVGDGDDGLAAVHLLEVLLDLRLGLHIDGRGRIVHNQDRRIVRERAGQRQALLLPAGQAHAAFAHDGVITLRHRPDEIVRAGDLGHFLDISVVAIIAGTKTDVAADGVGEQERILRHDAHLRAQGGQRPVACVDAVDEHMAHGRVVEAGDKADERGLARAGFAEDAELGAGGHGEVEVLEDRGLRVVREGEADVVEADVALDVQRAGLAFGGLLGTGCSGSPGRSGSLIIALDLLDDRDRLLDGFGRVGLLHDARLFGEQLTNLDAAGVESLPVVDEPAGLAHRAVDHPQEGVETHQIAEGHVALDDKKAAEAERDELQREAEAVQPRHVLARVVGQGHVALHVIVVVLVELFGLVRFAHECLDHTVALDVLFDHGVEGGQRVADGEEQRVSVRGQAAREHKNERRDAGQDERESPIDGEHHAQGAHEHDHAVGDLIAHPTQAVADRVGVGGQAAHDVAGACVVEVREVELVQLLVFVGDEAVDRVLAETLHPHLVAVSRAHADDGHEDHQSTQTWQFVGMSADDDAVHDDTGQNRNGQGHRVVGDEQ